MATPARDVSDWNFWWDPWKDHIRCGHCGGLAELPRPCPICHVDYSNNQEIEIELNGRKKTILPAANAGALNWSQYALLTMMHRDWTRPLSPVQSPRTNKISPRALVVLVFWTFFESLMDWFYVSAMAELPSGVRENLLSRHSFIGARMNGLHRVLFARKYSSDLKDVGGDRIALHLERLQRSRNDFIHGNPEAIDDDLVVETVRLFPEFCEVWIRSFNLRCAKRPN